MLLPRRSWSGCGRALNLASQLEGLLPDTGPNAHFLAYVYALCGNDGGGNISADPLLADPERVFGDVTAEGVQAVAARLEPTPKQLEACRVVAEDLNPMGLHLLGLDFIGEFLTEVNITSPTTIVQINQVNEIRADAVLVDELERSLSEDAELPGSVAGPEFLSREEGAFEEEPVFVAREEELRSTGAKRVAQGGLPF